MENIREMQATLPPIPEYDKPSFDLISRYNTIKNVFDSEECQRLKMAPLLPHIKRILTQDIELVVYILNSPNDSRFASSFRDTYNDIYVNKIRHFTHMDIYSDFTMSLIMYGYH